MAMLRSGLHSRRGLGDHGGNVLLFEWLISLRFTPEDARGYATALVRLGFDDLQSVREVSLFFRTNDDGASLDCVQTHFRGLLKQQVFFYRHSLHWTVLARLFYRRLHALRLSPADQICAA